MEARPNMKKIASRFDIPYRYLSHSEIRSGIINRTYLVNFVDDASKEYSYVFQKINTKVFQSPHEVMSNIIRVTEHIKQHMLETDGTYARRVLSFSMSKDGKPYYEDAVDGFWRAYEFIGDSVAYNCSPSGTHFFQAGKAFGQFQLYLSDFDAQNLYETIPDFHNTIVRMQNLRTAIEEDRAERASSVQKEIDFVLSREQEAGTLVRALESGEIPWRVTHNDTKINNVLFNTNSDEAICVIDLDTVMPGSSLFDFGDAIRSGACLAAEDEPNLDKVTMDLEMYRLFTKGYIKGLHGLLTPKEIEFMPLSAQILTLELAARFLTDYLNGDVYFHTDYSGQNLLRTRTQIKLVQDIESKLPQMSAFANEYAEKYLARFADQPKFCSV